jgi:alginate O-acetyltransferase complex protein AlgI
VQSNIGRSIAWVITMLSVVVAWVPFRAESMEGAMVFFRAMFGGNGLLRSHISEGGIALAEVIGSSSISFGAMFNEGIVSGKGAAWILVLLLFVVWLPNTQQIMRRYKPALQIYKNEIKRMDYLWLEWRPLGLWAIFYSLVFMFAMFNLSSASEFLYFQF